MSNKNENFPLRIYTADGKIKEEILIKPIELSYCWQLLGGYLEHFKSDEKYMYFADEDGLSKNLGKNPHFDGIVGTVLAIPKRWVQ